MDVFYWYLDVGIWLTSFLIVGSKFLDCWTTRTMMMEVSQEKNPMARRLMKKFGVGKTVRSVFLLSIAIVAAAMWLLVSYFNSSFHKLSFIFVGMVVTLAQLAVAHTNWTKKLNFFTKYLLRIYEK